MAGKLIADAINGDDERLRVMEQVKHHPFPGGQLLRKPALALGMAFERSKEVIRNRSF
jgi:hypothetical protein